ncbi:MAG: transcriptional regulator [Candidatus Azotimanducaceae bacterium]|jgi:transcriptional regulator
MYNLSPFKQEEDQQLKSFIAQYPLATLVSINSSGLEANHIPLYFVEDEDAKPLLKGHIAKANPLWKEVADKSRVLMIFQGPQSYISPNWYPSKKEHGKVVPTWNYAVVHLRGEISFISDNAWKLDMLNTLTNKSERHQTAPWKVADAPEGYIERQVAGIVGIEISLSSMQGKWKMSQNKSASDHQGVVDGLSNSDSPGAGETADLMKRK